MAVLVSWLPKAMELPENDVPEICSDAKFPEMIVWGSKAGHMPFLEDKADLMKAIIHYKTKYF